MKQRTNEISFSFLPFESSNRKWHKMDAIQCVHKYYLFNSLAEIISFHRLCVHVCGSVCVCVCAVDRHRHGTTKPHELQHQKVYTLPLIIIVIMLTMIAMFLSNIWFLEILNRRSFAAHRHSCYAIAHDAQNFALSIRCSHRKKRNLLLRT